MPDSDIREKLREKYYQEGEERSAKHKQDRLNKIFSDLGDINDFYLYSHDYKPETLAAIRKNIKSGDREAMLALLIVTANALEAFNVLSEDVRKALAQSLQEMRINLEESRGFLPRGRGKRSKKEKREQLNKEFWTALNVEHLRIRNGISLEEAIARISEEKGITEHLVQKRWKRRHKDAKATINNLNLFKLLKREAKQVKEQK